MSVLDKLLVAVTLLAVTGCTPRPAIVFFDIPPETVTTRSVLLASERSLDSLSGGGFGADRSERLQYAQVDVVIPLDREIGDLPVPQRLANPDKNFGIVSFQELPGLPALERSANSDAVFLYVHGYNTNAAESLYRTVQVANDYGITGQAISFSWASAGDPWGYAYDRDSALFARDSLETVLDRLTNQSGETVFIMAHSMGSQLVVETLRQMSIAGKHRALSRIDGVALVAPDMDPDVFRRLLARIEPVPDPFLVFVSKNDFALSLSSLLVGQRSRLGAITSAQGLEDLPVTVIDVSAFEDGFSSHDAAITSPSAIAVIRNLGMSSPLLNSGNQFVTLPRNVRKSGR